VQLGTKLTLTYLDQQRATLPDEATLKEVLCAKGTDQVVVHGNARHVAGYLRDFLFDGSDMHRQVRTLSGGERARLLFARAFCEPSNLLVLDEPTNDLDIETLDLLQELLSDYAGTLLLVSHDRDFLDRVVTSTIVMDGTGGVQEYAGGYSDYLTQRTADAPVAVQTTATSKKKAPRAKTKLSYKEQKEMDALGATIESLEAEIATLEEKLADGDFYGRDPAGFTAAMKRLDAAKAELEPAEERWLELEILRDELAGA
jgi:ATP-binding cassette subfamily F protein uup